MVAAQELFGRYVRDIEGILLLMERTNSVVVGEAVLSTFSPRLRRSIEKLEVIPSCSDNEQILLFQEQWKDFLALQGYEQGRVVKEGRVCYPIIEMLRFGIVTFIGCVICSCGRFGSYGEMRH